jgi:exonuclease SbcC/exonuclease SbcD
MRIAHIGDVHWGLGYPGPTPQSRFEDITRVMDWVADRIIEEQCNLVLFAGDAFKDARVFLDRASVEIKAFADWLRKVTAAGIPVIAISGTPSHDAISAYRLIQDMQIPGVTILTEPGVVHHKGLSIACLPGMSRSALVTQEEYRDLPTHVIHHIMTDKIKDICQGLRAQCENLAVLLAHLTYDLANKGFEDVLMQHEPVLTKEAIQGFDLVCLGHIHRPQQNGRVFYCGSPERLSFNDEQITPGFWIHEFNLAMFRQMTNPIKSRFIETPARPFVTATWEDWVVEGFIKGRKPGPGFKDAVVRLWYSCSEELAKQMDRKALERALYEVGAFYVAEIKADIQRIDRVRDQGVTETLGPVEALARWAKQHNIPDNEIEALQAMTAGLLEEVTI